MNPGTNPYAAMALPVDTPARKMRRDVKRYREALEKIAAIPNAATGGDWDEIEQARDIARKALEEEK